jgi:hypothetical protein
MKNFCESIVNVQEHEYIEFVMNNKVRCFFMTTSTKLALILLTFVNFLLYIEELLRSNVHFNQHLLIPSDIRFNRLLLVEFRAFY